MIGRKIKELREKWGLSQKDFASLLGISTMTLSRYEKGEREPTAELLKKLAQKFSVDLNWLLGIKSIKKTEENEYVSVILSDVYASAGKGIINQKEEMKVIQLNKEFANLFFGINDDNGYFVLYAYGNSMYPTIDSGDICLGVFFEKENILLDGNIYVFRLNGELFIKRLVKDKRKFKFTSDNPNFPEIEVSSIDNLQIIGRILAVIRKV